MGMEAVKKSLVAFDFHTGYVGWTLEGLGALGVHSRYVGWTLEGLGAFCPAPRGIAPRER